MGLGDVLNTPHEETTMKMTGIMLIAISCLIGEASAQDKKPVKRIAVAQAVYHVTDMLGKKKRTEAWEVRLPVPDYQYAKPYTVFKGSRGQTMFQEITSDGRWVDETRTEGLDTYLFERYDVHPSQLDPGESSFGHVEERSIQGDRVLLSWPIFFSVEEESSETLRLTVKSFMPGNRQLLIVRTYVQGELFAPLKESYQLTEGGTLLLHYLYERVR